MIRDGEPTGNSGGGDTPFAYSSTDHRAVMARDPGDADRLDNGAPSRLFRLEHAVRLASVGVDRRRDDRP